MKIGALARATRTTTPTVRYYEHIGLLPRAPRQQGSQRVYDEQDVRRLIFIRRCRDFDFPIDQVRRLAGALDAPAPGTCDEVRDLAAAHLKEVQHKRQELQALESSLRHFIQDCDRCGSGDGADCRVLHELANSPAAPARSRKRGSS